MLGRSGHRDAAVDRFLDARPTRLRVDEQKLEPLREFRGQRPAAGRVLEGWVADDAGDPVGVRGELGVKDRDQLRSGSMDDGDAAAADEDRHVGAREHGPDDRLRFCHDLFRRPVVDAQRGQGDVAEPDVLEAFLPRLVEPVPGLGAVADDGEAA